MKQEIGLAGSLQKVINAQMTNMSLAAALTAIILIPFVSRGQTTSDLRPPAVPLVTFDPYLSVWSPGDRLTDVDTVHWTGIRQHLASLIRIDGHTFRLMGTEPAGVPALNQVGLEVTPTRTIYSFEGAGIRLTLTFMTPLLPSDLDVLSRPVTYLTWKLHSIDSKKHSASLFYDNTAELVVNTNDEQVAWSYKQVGTLGMVRMGTQAQLVLGKSGDDLRIDWGYLYVAANGARGVSETVAEACRAQDQFASSGVVTAPFDTRMPRAVEDHTPAIVVTFDSLEVSAKPIERHIMLAYDEIYSIELLHRRLKPYWRRNGDQPEDLLRKASVEYSSLQKRCERFDKELHKDLEKMGGAKYASLGALAYRQALAGNGLAADRDGRPLFFTKENFSDGSISTPDVIFPESPILLLFSPELMRASLEPVFQYVTSGHWRFPFAPAQLGTYPLANGQTYGGGETSETGQQPVEESANMLIMTAALAQLGHASSITDKYWPVLTTWAEYVRKNGLDPGKQLCTDDFNGEIAHNANLSMKAIEALAAYAYLCKLRGDETNAEAYLQTAKGYSADWIKMSNDGDHSRLAFDQPGTWSQKYNLVWDKIMGFNLFPQEVARKELDCYKRNELSFGFPLDSLHTYTKLDWETWSASLTDSRSDFDKLMSPVYDFVDKTPVRVPLGDWYEATDAKPLYFRARPVVGAVFIRILYAPSIWKKWSSR